MTSLRHRHFQAARRLMREPGFTLVALLTLALGIGATVSIFSVVSGVLIRPLPYDDPDRVVQLIPQHERYGESDLTFSYPDILDLREHTEVLRGVAAQDTWRPTAVYIDGAERLEGASVSASYFSVLGVRPALGRFFSSEEDAPGTSQAVVISHGLWQRRYGGDANAPGRTIRLDRAPYEIVGVAPADFEDPRLSRGEGAAPEIWRVTPAYWVRDDWARRGTRFLTAVARLQPGVPLGEAQATVSTALRRLEEAYPESNAGWGARLVPLKERIVGPVRMALLALFAAVGLVLLIACANLANLLLARSVRREHEIAVRAALGASRGRIAGYLLTESVLLALVGGAAGVLLAWLATDAIVTLGAGEIPRLGQVRIDSRVLAFAVVVSVTTGVLFGLTPMLRLSRDVPRRALAAGSRWGSLSRGQMRFWRSLITIEVAMTVVLLVGAGLLIRSMWRLYGVDPGLEPGGVLTMAVRPSWNDYPDDARTHALYERLIERLDGLPGVDAAAATNILPFSGGYWGTRFRLEGEPTAEEREDAPSAEIRTATPDLFPALRTPVLRGRGIQARDAEGDPLVVVINDALARRYFPNGGAVGERIILQDQPYEVVGVVADVRQFALAEPPEPVLYLAQAQAPSWLMRNSVIVLRTSADPLDLAAPARQAVRELDPRIPIAHLRSMEAVLAETLAEPRFRTVLLAVFAALAITLAVVGVYGLVAYGVAQRTREIGIRVALGAHTSEILSAVMSRALRAVLAGLLLGMIGALGAGKLLAGLLFGIAAYDPVTLLTVPLLLTVAALAACYIPARRAARLDPTVALRAE